MEDPLEEGMAIHYGILSWRIPIDRGAWQATVHGVTNSRTGLKCTEHACMRALREGFVKGLSDRVVPWFVTL